MGYGWKEKIKTSLQPKKAMNPVTVEMEKRLLRFAPREAVPCQTLFGQGISAWRGWSAHVPRGLPTGRLVHLSSSRIGRQWSRHPEWLTALRVLATRLARIPDIVLATAPGMTCDPVIRWLCRRLSIPTIAFMVDHLCRRSCRDHPKNIDMNDWPHWYPCQLMPSDIERSRRRSEPLDFGVIEVADIVYVLAARCGGTVARATADRLARGKQTWLLLNDRLTPRSVQDPFMASGAIGWYPMSTDAPAANSAYSIEANGNGASARGRHSAPIESLSEETSSRFLIHWTRPGCAPWPDQSSLAWIEELMFRSQNLANERCDALARILATQRLLGTNRLTRSTRPVICFADVRLDELETRRIFRPHLGRWDFTPFGLAIDRDWLQERGARPVMYGSHADWSRLAEADRPFFQLAPDPEEPRGIDWRTESEWRLVGDLDLKQIPVGAARVFVPSRDIAQQFAPLSRWPIVVLNAGQDRS